MDEGDAETVKSGNKKAKKNKPSPSNKRRGSLGGG